MFETPWLSWLGKISNKGSTKIKINLNGRTIAPDFVNKLKASYGWFWILFKSTCNRGNTTQK